ncbi:voltage-gated potassium channel [Neoconidiobolus thromboides FSU 785]|nr:voltage-gated potassium channel [Neoconidiobolus thromboides FSU 785]
MSAKKTNGYNYLAEDDTSIGMSQFDVPSNPQSPSLNRPKIYSNLSASKLENTLRTSPNKNNRVIDIEEENEIVAEMEDGNFGYHHTHSHLSTNTWKRDLYLIMEDPSSSNLALIFNLSLAALIIFSVLLTTIETIPSIRELKWSIWFVLELLVMLLFTIELALRVVAHSHTTKQLLEFLISPLTILDFFSIIPYYVMLLISQDTSVEFRFTILRVFRLFRLFRAYKYSNLLQLSIEVMLIAVKKSVDALAALLFFMLITIVLFSTFLYFAERGSWSDERKTFLTSHGVPSAFDSIPAAFWFVIVTITTTGYGDIVPSTFLGKVIAFPLMMLGILLIALPSVIVGRNFTVVWDVLKRRKIDMLQFSQEQPNQSLTEMVEDIEIELAGELHVNSDGQVVNSTKNMDKEMEIITNQIQSLLLNQDKLHNEIQQLQNICLDNSQQISQLISLLSKNNTNNSEYDSNNNNNEYDSNSIKIE